MSGVEYRFAELANPAPGQVSGAVVRYGSVAVIAGAFRERFMPGAFGDLDAADVIVNMQHDRTRPLARSGGGLALTDSEAELRADMTLPDTTDGRDARVLVERGVLRGWSVEFHPVEERMAGGVREIVRADLRGIALVDRPAYPDATAELAKRYAESARTTRRVWL